ncbi:MAG: cellulase family glycosylhydrolase [Fimbriimonadaceae bacterium]|nr:cellulase family glycosylhydrolase [Fimbriimonadaceae bacterium]
MNLITILSLLATPTLYGPVNLELAVPVEGNPFDPAENDVRLRLTKGGRATERLAFFANGKWRARIATPEPGRYAVEVWRNSKKVVGSPKSIQVPKTRIHHVRTSGTKFELGGKPYWPVGTNLGWQSPNFPDMTEQIATLAKAGGNWTRIWASNWDDKSPFWTQNTPLPKDGWMSEVALNRWDQLVRAAEKSGVYFQYVFFNHGQFSTEVNPNWPTHPWNKANGGFLPDAKAFFTDPEAKRRARMFLRYAAARWGASPAIMAWELWNEVQFTDLARSGDWKTVAAWHDEMADYMRSVDSYGHLITTSSELGAPIWRKMDYAQGHGYPASIEGLIMGSTSPDPRKPLFFGEVGLGNSSGRNAQEERMAIRDGIWGGFFAGQAGAGQYWFWDRMNLPGMLDEYRNSTKALRTIGNPAGFRPTNLTVDVASSGTLVMRPGRGWEKSDLMDFNLPTDANPSKLGKLSSFLQGRANRVMQPKPLTLRFSASKNGVFRAIINQVSQSGAAVSLSCNGVAGPTKRWDAASSNRNVNETLEMPFSPGDNVVVVDNDGADWVNVSQYEATTLAPDATALAAANGNTLILRVRAAAPSQKLVVRHPLLKGVLNLRVLSLADGKVKDLSSTVKRNGLEMIAEWKDQIVIFTR